jgi:multidrug efflux system outer membrane protein
MKAQFQYGLILLFALLLAGGCAVGPNYQKPNVSSPDQFRGGRSSTDTNSIADLKWWDLYQDPTLSELIRVALTNNYDVRIAATRMEQALQAAHQTRSQYLPSAAYDGEISRGKNSFLGNPSPGRGTGDGILAATSAFWEVDLWGRVRRLNESARAQFFASEEARRGVMLSLVGSVAEGYFQLLALDLELEIANRTTNAFSETARMFRVQKEQGIASQLDVARAEAALTSSAATIPELERQIAITENQINLLLGRAPGTIDRHSKLHDQTMRPEIPAGIPSALLERRPDILQAEQTLRAANANIGVAAADFLPKIGLTVLAGKVSPELSAFTGGAANFWSIAGGATGPIFQGGALRAQYKQAQAARDQALLQYEQTALNAFHEVSDALISHEKLGAVRDQQVQAVAAFREAVRISTQRYMVGTSQYFEVLDAETQLFPAENALAQTELNQLLTIVQLYKALGGGWQSLDHEWNSK